MVEKADPVPLPEVLGRCACPGRPNRHLTTCQIAIEFDETPLSERPEFELGRRFATVSWDFPVRITGNLRIHVEVDPVAIIRSLADQYRAFQMESGYEEWEKPMVFLTHLIEEQYEVGVWFGGRRMSNDRSFMDDLRDDGWKPEDTERLHALLDQPEPDPNQGVLDTGEGSE